MVTHYLVDFENVGNNGISNIENTDKNDHIYIFSTANAANIKNDIYKYARDIVFYLVPAGKQSVDMHIISFLGYLLATSENQCNYVIVSKDTDYDNVVEFWKMKGYFNISRKSNVLSNENLTKGVNFEDKINEVLSKKGYDKKTINKVSNYVRINMGKINRLGLIHNSLQNEFNKEKYLDIYREVKKILNTYPKANAQMSKKECQVRSFFGSYFKENIYKDKKKEIIKILIEGINKEEISDKLVKLYADGDIVVEIYKTIQPLISDLPWKG